MAIPQRIRDYLESQDVPYEELHHSQAFSAQEMAHSLHVSGKICAKAVVAEGDHEVVIIVVPATHRLKVGEFKSAMKAHQFEMLVESELVGLFPDCDLGAVPPFGNLYGMEVFMAESLTDNEVIAFNAGSHTEVIKLAYKDFERLVKPKVVGFTT